MVVVIDGYYIDKPRGFGRYIRELIFALSQYPALGQRYVVLVPSGTKDLPISENISYVRLPKIPFPLWEQIISPLVAMCLSLRESVVVHHPYNTKPFLALFYWFPHCVTMHDLTFLKYPGENLYQRIGAWYRRLCLVWIKVNRCAFVTVSIESSREIKEILQCNAEVVYTAVELFLSEKTSKNQTFMRKFFVHIGGVSAHKNTRRVIEAFLRIGNKDVDLVVLGVPEDCEISRQYSCFSNIIFPGWISDELVKQYIRGAVALVFPSLKEGFGLPIVEAFSMSCPVITSKMDPMKEVAGGAAYLVDPLSVDELHDAMRELLCDERKRKHYSLVGNERYEVFSSRVMAKLTSDFYSKQLAVRISE